jgi:hypothetical protein
MGSHVDTPEWQSFERRMRGRYLARRRRMRVRWAIAISAAFVIGASLAPPGVERRSTSALRKVENPDALVVSLPRRDSNVTVLRFPFAPAIITDPTAAAATSFEPASFFAPPPQPSEPSLTGSAPEPEPAPEWAPPPAPPAPPPAAPTPAESPRPEPVAPIVATVPEGRMPPAVGTTATIPPPTAVSVEQDVRKVIDRYRDAYERLDATAARAVWPGVDEAALSRAFDGLTSQRIEFERCDIWRDAQAAFASCAGRASYVPKVGRAQNDVPRAWHFRLQRRPAGWAIESAEVK